jgi:hypothetical protein
MGRMRQRTLNNLRFFARGHTDFNSRALSFGRDHA